jgi:transcription antitermination factor NusG
MSLATSEERWYVLHVRPNYELAVAMRLRQLGVEEYLPFQKEPGTSPRRKFNEGMPLFPGYVFTYLNLYSGPRLYSIPGVMRLLGYGGHATPLENHEIATVRTIATSPLPVEPCPFLSPGENILLIDGPLKGVSGTYLRSAKGDKLVVSLPLLRRSLAVTVASEWVAAQKTEGDPPPLTGWQ